MSNTILLDAPNLGALEKSYLNQALDSNYVSTVGPFVPEFETKFATYLNTGGAVEKHFTINRDLPGPDHRTSLEPEELKSLVSAIRQVEVALGCSRKYPTPAELKNRSVARKSLVAGCDIIQGTVFHEGNVVVKRPGTGISPALYWEVMGKKAPRNFRQDELIEI